MKKIIQAFHLASLVLTFVLKLRFSADTSIADVIKKCILKTIAREKNCITFLKEQIFKKELRAGTSH